MRSMTGFGRGTAENSSIDMAFTVEISSINRKQLDIRAVLPHEISSAEPQLRGMVSKQIRRGAVTAKVNVQLGPAATQAGVQLNAPLLEALVDKSRALGTKLGLSENIHLKDFLALPGAIEYSGPDYNVPEVETTFQAAVSAALEDLVAMKEREGANIKSDIEQRLQLLRDTVALIEPLAKKIPEMQREKLLHRLENADLHVDAEDERILREVVIYCDKADVSEEITRLYSHFKQFDEYLNQKDGPVGRSLDFLIQEINRETTTLGNKAAGCEISPLIVKMKTELEKIREQVQNVE